MQISRLFKIVYLLQDRKQMTAKELAEHFEVSTRTILRDIDKLTEAGIPIYTQQGKGGGISILENFILNKTLISKEEQNRILFGLQSLALTGELEGEELLSKLQAFFQSNQNNWIEVDFSRWGAGPIEKERFAQLKDAILSHHTVSFAYSSMNGETLKRKVNPLRLLFKSNAWYLQGYCLLKEDYRTFKIYRMSQVETMDEVFDEVEFQVPPLEPPVYYPEVQLIPIVLEYSREAAYRAYDDFHISQIKQLKNGDVRVEAEIVDHPGIYEYILSLGKFVKIIEPDYMKEHLLHLITEVQMQYE